MTGADLVVAHLQRAGVERVFTLSGNGMDPFYVACAQAGLELVDVHNEQAAPYMAEVEGHLAKRSQSEHVVLSRSFMVWEHTHSRPMDQYQLTRVIRRNLLTFAEILLTGFLGILGRSFDKPNQPA